MGMWVKIKSIRRRLRRHVICERCAGSGIVGPRACPACDGTGWRKK